VLLQPKLAYELPDLDPLRVRFALKIDNRLVLVLADP